MRSIHLDQCGSYHLITVLAEDVDKLRSNHDERSERLAKDGEIFAVEQESTVHNIQEETETVLPIISWLCLHKEPQNKLDPSPHEHRVGAAEVVVGERGRPGLVEDAGERLSWEGG